jgi:ubiquinone/menaquinone biosynthesis C-methylase UbiE
MLAACATALPDAHFTVVDESAAMLAEARRRWAGTGGKQGVVFEQADLRTWRSDGEHFDLVVTNFLLDCFAPEELSRVMVNLSACAAPQASWLVADFTVPPAGWRRLRARAVLALAYGFFRVATGIAADRITPPDEALRGAGFILQGRAHFNQGLLHADCWTRGVATPAP